jgi:multidrug efflux pump subunit AcrA (membrane-fusion protein)
MFLQDKSDRREKQMAKWTATGLPGGAAIQFILVAAVLVLTSCHKPEEKPAGQAPQAVSVRTEKLSTSHVVSSFSLTGVMDSRKSVSIFPRVDGYIAQIRVKPGQSVTTGQILIEIDPSKEEAAVAAKESSVQLAEADLAKETGSLKSLQADRAAKESQVRFQQIEYDRYYWLEHRGVVPTESVDKEQRDLEVAQARLNSLDAEIAAQKDVITRARRRVDEARAEMRAEKVQLKYYSLKSPFAGVVGDIPVKVGDSVGPHTILTQISESRPLEVNLQVPKDQAGSLHTGVPLEILNEEGNVLTTSKIFYVSPTVDLSSQSVLVKGLCPNLHNEFRPDQTVQVRVLLSSAPGITVPTESISFVAGQAFVFLARRDDTGRLVASQRPIKVSDIRNNRATISSGLKDADEIVVSGIQMLADGTPIQSQGGASVH